jgi:hypothetical protein
VLINHSTHLTSAYAMPFLWITARHIVILRVAWKVWVGSAMIVVRKCNKTVVQVVRCVADKSRGSCRAESYVSDREQLTGIGSAMVGLVQDFLSSCVHLSLIEVYAV